MSILFFFLISFMTSPQRDHPFQRAGTTPRPASAPKRWSMQCCRARRSGLNERGEWNDRNKPKYYGTGLVRFLFRIVAIVFAVVVIFCLLSSRCGVRYFFLFFLFGVYAFFSLGCYLTLILTATQLWMEKLSRFRFRGGKFSLSVI